MSFLKRLLPTLSQTTSLGWSTIFILLGTVSVLSVTLPSVVSDLLNPIPYKQGQVATHTVRAPRDVLVADTLGTEKRREQAIANAERVFTISDNSEEAVAEELAAFFSVLGELSPTGNSEKVRAERANFERRFNIDLVGEEWEMVFDRGIWTTLEESVLSIATPILRKGIIANKRPLRHVLGEGQRAILRSAQTGSEREISSPTAVFDLREAAEVAEASFPNKGFGRGEVFDSLVEKFIESLLKPNVIFDTEETEKRVKAASENIEQVYYRVKQGEVIVRAGDVINASQERRLEFLHEQIDASDAWRQWAGYFVLSSLILLSLYVFTLEFWHERKVPTRDLILIAFTLIGSFLVMKLFWVLSNSLSHTFYLFDPSTYILATPVAAGGILLQVTLGAPGVLLFVMSFSLLTGFFLENSWIVLVMIVLGNTIGAIAVRHCSRRSAFIWAGFRVAAVNVITVFCFLLLFSEYSTVEMANRVLWAILGGALSGILAAGLTPIAEHFGGYITNIKLLELASLDHPLLRELSVQAPGTWNHSMVIGQMGEAAAEAIGANALLTRVGAYYHDVGKMKKPAYFVENQTKVNRHDKLTPSMSALIIKTHVKDGIELAEKAGLPTAIIDFIPQHHGTALIEYFYDKALKEAEADGDDDVEESNYRYGGPKPQSKEAGILMMADGIEASSRTLSDPTPAKIQGLVQKMINKVFASGELDESTLTLKDLHFVAKAFTRVLTGIYHRRVEYSEPAEKVKDSTGTMKIPKNLAAKDEGKENTPSEVAGKKGNGNRAVSEEGSKESTEDSGSKKSDSKNSKEALKRLGI